MPSTTIRRHGGPERYAINIDEPTKGANQQYLWKRTL